MTVVSPIGTPAIGLPGSAPNPVLAEIWRGPVLECVHRGAVAIAGPDGVLIEAIGDVERIMLPRSACKMVQALPLVESGAADAARLSDERLALSCASHSGAHAHVSRVDRWLADLGFGDDDLRCGAHSPLDPAARRALREGGQANRQAHNNCSGKHTGFLTLTKHLRAGPDYVETDHPVQRAVRAAVAETCGEEPKAHAIDGCSAPNFAVSLAGLARAMAGFARPQTAFSGARAVAATRLRDAMMAHPVLVAGEERENTKFMVAAEGRAAVKSGAEGVYCAILPERGLGIALKVDDGASRGAQAAIAALLVRHGAIAANHPAALAAMDAPILNARGREHGRMRASDILMATPS
ncbi:MAG: asparaginase [Pseudomonadota bacterium]